MFFRSLKCFFLYVFVENPDYPDYRPFMIKQITFLQVLGKIIQLLLWNKSFAGVSVKIIKFFEQEGNIFQFVLQNCYLTCRIISRFRKRNVLKNIMMMRITFIGTVLILFQNQFNFKHCVACRPYQ